MGTQEVELNEDLSTVEAKALTDEIRASISRTLDAMADVEHAVKRAYDGRAWMSLGYSSWDAYCSAEFSETRLWSSIEERQARTLSLREAGMSQRAIAAVLGVGKGTTERDLTLLSTAPNGAVDNGPETQLLSQGIDGKSRPASKPVTKELVERRLTVARLADGGLSQEQIAARVGVSQATISNDLREVEVLEKASPEKLRSLVADPVATSRDVLEAFEHLTLPTVNLGQLTQNAVRDLHLTVKFLYENVVMANEWIVPAQRKAAVEALVPKVGDSLLVLFEALAEIKVEDLPAGEAERLRWSHTISQVRSRLERMAVA